MLIKIGPQIFLQSIRPIYYIQLITATTTCLIRGNAFYSRSLLQKFWLSIWVLMSLYFFYETYHNLNSKKGSSFAIWSFTLFLAIAIYFIQVINLTYTSKCGVALFRLCQNLQRFEWTIKRGNIEYLNGALLLGTFVLFLQRTLAVLLNKNDYTDRIFITITMFVFEVDILLWMFICSYLKLSLRNINDSIKKVTFCTNVSKIKIQYIHSRPNSIVIAAERTLFSYHLLRKTYKYLLILFYVNFFVWSMTYVNTIFISIKNKQTLTEKFLAITIEGFKKTIILILICINGELFKKEVADTEKICLEILDCHQNDVVSDCAEKLLWLLRELPPNFKLCGLLHLDSQLPYRFFSLILVYVVALLQFLIL